MAYHHQWLPFDGKHQLSFPFAALQLNTSMIYRHNLKLMLGTFFPTFIRFAMPPLSLTVSILTAVRANWKSIVFTTKGSRDMRSVGGHFVHQADDIWLLADT